MMRRSLWIIAVLAACGGDAPPPVEVAKGRLIARISSEPAQITLLLDGAEVWSTRAGGQAGKDKHEPPHGFAAIGSRATTVEMMFGAFRFTENKSAEVWRPIDQLADVTETAEGASFTLLSDGDSVGTGRLVFGSIPLHVQIELETDAQRVQITTPCPGDEHLVGLGGQSFDVDHRGETVPLFVQEDGIGKFPDPDDIYAGLWFLTGRKHTTHTPMPMVLSSRGYALAVKTDARAVFALGSDRPDTARFEAWDGTLDLNVFIGDQGSAPDALGHMVEWVGKPERPPLSIFAPWVDAIYGSANVRRIAQKLRSSGIPASAIWTEDWRGGEDTATGYALDEDWRADPVTYPDFDQLASDLHGMGFAFLTYHNTFIDDKSDVLTEAIAGGYAIKDANGAPYTFTGITFGGSKLLDLANPAAVTWAKGVMGEAYTRGSDGWMADFAEWQPTDAVLASGEDALAVHNRYPVDWLKMTSEILTPRAGRFTPIHFARSAWVGSQKYVQVIWPGDQQTDFSDGDGLPSVIPMGINLGLAGFPYFGSDIAGYMSQGTDPTSEELFYRWTSFGAFNPVMRTHHGRSARQNFQWENDAAATAHFRRWARLHMQLAAYLWGSSGSFDRDGLPLMRMIALEYPDEPWAWTTIDEYLLGDRLLVAPIQAKGATSRSITLPAGRWFPLLTGTAVMGGEITATAAKTEIPVYVPEGSLLVLYPDGVDTPLPASQLASAVTTDEIGGNREVWLYPGTAANPEHTTWNDDDGPAAPAQWTWTGRSATAALPTTATFKGASTPVTMVGGQAQVTVTGDGTLVFGNGGTLTINRGDSTAQVRVRLRGP
ncbi:MAG: Alpha-glucosidase [Myxococcales bacterium]|nr:Alpha-glucosidase [Myxococcales bacterium]